MASRNRIAGAAIISRCSQDFDNVIKQLGRTCQSYTSGSLKTRGSRFIPDKLNDIARLTVSIDGNLSQAYKAIYALSGESRYLPLKFSNVNGYFGMVAPFASIARISFDIEVKAENCDNLHANIGTIGNKLSDIHSQLSAPLHEMENLIIQDQWVSSLTIIDYLFPFNGINKLIHVNNVRNTAIINIKNARTKLKKLQSYVGSAENARQNGGRTIYYTLDDIKTKLINCEDTVKRRMYALDIKATSLITADSNTPRDTVKNAIDRLEKKQKEYTYRYGHESPEIAAEIERLKKLCGYERNGIFFVTLTPDFDQKAMYQGAGTGYCTSAALCMALAIYSNEPKDNYDFTSQPYWIDGVGVNWGVAYDPNNSNPWSYQDSQTIFARAYEQLKKGKPSIFYGPNGNLISGEHAVTIVGLAEGADPNNLKPSDFLVIDPGDGQVKLLSEVGYKSYNAKLITIKD